MPHPSPPGWWRRSVERLGKDGEGRSTFQFFTLGLASGIRCFEYGIMGEYEGVRSREGVFMQHVEKIHHSPWLVDACALSQPSGHQLVAQCMVAAQEQYIFVNASPFIESSACQDDDAHRAVVPPPCQSQWIIFWLSPS